MTDQNQRTEFDRISRLIIGAHTPDELRTARLESSEYIHRKLKYYDAFHEMGELMSHREAANRRTTINTVQLHGNAHAEPSPALLRLKQIKLATFQCPNDIPSIIASYKRCIHQARELSFSDPEERHDAELYVKLLENRIHALKQELSADIFSS